MTANLDDFRAALCRGLLPLLDAGQLLYLRRGLADDDPRLLQAMTTEPLSFSCARDWPVQGACLTVYPFAFEGIAAPGESDRTVAEADEWFAQKCFEMDRALGGPGECRHLLNAWDDLPRAEAFAAALDEVEAELRRRGVSCP